MGKKVEHPLDILREELQQTNVALKCAYDKFNYVTEPELIEASIYEISALKARYSYLLRCIKEQEPAARSGGRTAVPAAVAASAALCEDETLIAQAFQNSGLTHSQTLLPMVEHLLQGCSLTPADLDLIAVAAGPGSFTGLRIGVATAKGLAWAAQRPWAGSSSLESMAWNLAGFSGQVCAAMDARRHQIYNARFQVDGQCPRRLTPDRAISLDDLVQELAGTQTPQLVVGDGAQLCYDALTAAGIPAVLAPPNLRMQSAWGVARQALALAQAGQTLSPAQLVPVYHRLSQAERERLEREQAAQTPHPQ